MKKELLRLFNKYNRISEIQLDALIASGSANAFLFAMGDKIILEKNAQTDVKKMLLLFGKLIQKKVIGAD